jgi:hypothetical protein
MAGLGGAFGGLLGNSILQQIVLYNVVSALIGSALSPYLQALTNQVNQASPLVPLSPGELAEAVLRNVMEPGQAAAEARFAGLNAERFAVLSRLAGNAPPPEAMAVALRRKLVNQGRYLEGIRQGRLRDEWAELIKELAVQEPGPAAPLQALLQGQLPEGRARELYERFGGAPEHFDWLFDTEGQAPTPTQALELANRGIIPWSGSGPDATTYEQAFLEGPWRNKWLGPFRALGEYLPPPRTVTAMYREGSLSRERAAELLSKQGLAPDMVAAYLSSGSEQKTADTKTLAQSTVLALYRDRLIGRPDASAMLQALRYGPEEADFILQVADVEVAQRFLNSAVGRVRTLYVGHRIDRTRASSTLAQLQIPAEQIGDLVGIWDYERAANVRALTPAQVAAAFREGILDQSAAMTELTELGYLPHDAWLYLSITAKAELSDEPARDAVGSAPGQ